MLRIVMNLGIEVSLPRSEAPRFPDRCVVCRRDAPGSTTRVLTTTLGRGWIPVPRPGGFFTVRVPTCRSCGWGLQARRGLGVALTVVLGVVAAVVLGPRLEGFDPWARRLIVAGALVVALAPLLAWELLHPPKFSVTAWRDTVDYEFGDDATAHEFAQMNAVPWDESFGPTP